MFYFGSMMMLQGGGVAPLVEAPASNWKVAKPWLDSRCGSVSLCPWERHLMLGAKKSTHCGGPVWRKTCKQNSFCVGVVWQTQSIVQHHV